MQMTTEARAWLDATVRRILARHPLGDPERMGITYELMSHLHAAGEARAVAEGRSEVALGDLEAALVDAGGEAGLAAAFVQPLARPEERVLLWRRAGAFIIDALLLGIALTFVHGAFDVLARVGGRMTTDADFVDDGWGLMPWGFHDPSLPVWLQALVAIASAALVMGYFTWFEGREGRSLGKRALDLRVMRADGQPMTYREAFIRNLVKLSPLILLLDVLAMLVVFRKERQRVSDRIADTIVVRA